jgi:alkylation response protein AidB-like acyl-CoA dehydrogenase
MDFALSAQQQSFAASLHDLLASANGPAAARAWGAGDRKPGLEIWRSLADAGVTGLMVPPEQGGVGADAVDLVVACEEIGHHVVPGPVAESVAAAPLLLAAAPGAGRWLSDLAGGELIATVAARPWPAYAADAEAAGLVLLAEPGSIRTGVAGQSRPSVEAARTVSEVAPGELIVGGEPAGAAVSAALEYGALACAAQLLGAGRALLEAAAQHARQRVQFGQPVGAFQAVKHHLADVLIGLEFARPLLFGAAVALTATGTGPVTLAARRDVSAAKVACTEAATRAARVALQVHGAVGYTAEHDISLYLTKVEALARAWGSQAEHRARVLQGLAGTGPAGNGPAGNGPAGASE